MKRRKARPLRTEKGEYLRQVGARLADLEATIYDVKREVDRYIADLTNGGESDLKSVDYSKDRVMCSGFSLGFVETISKIDACKINLQKLREEKEELEKKKKRLVDLYASASGSDAQVFYLREVMGYTQEMTAEMLGYSTRQIQRIEKRLQEGVRI